MVVPEPKRVRTLQRQVNQLQRSTKTVQQRPLRAEPIHLRAGHPRASGSGWDRSVVGNEEKALCHVACVNRTVPTRFAWKSIQCNYGILRWSVSSPCPVLRRRAPLSYCQTAIATLKSRLARSPIIALNPLPVSALSLPAIVSREHRRTSACPRGASTKPARIAG